jgi:hypothetical protein
MNICELPADEVAKVLAGYSRLEFPDYPNWASQEYSPLRWYSSPGRLLRVDGTGSSSWVIARGQRKRDLKAMPGRSPVTGRSPAGNRDSSLMAERVRLCVVRRVDDPRLAK